MKTLPFLGLALFLVITACSHSPKGTQAVKSESTISGGFIEISGTKLNYVAEGTGIPCMVIGSSIYYPRTFSNKLRDHLRFWFIDMRWFASEYKPVKPGEFTLDTILSDIEKVRSELRLEKVLILGHSIHGDIAFEYAKRYPEKVAGIIMIGSPASQTNKEQEDAINTMWSGASEERQKIMNKNWKLLADMKNLTPSQFEIENYCLMSPKYWYDANYDARWLWKDMTMNTDILTSIYESVFKDYSVFRHGRSVPAPTFVALGKYDFVDPHSLWEGYEDIPGITIRLFDKCGHTPQLEVSDQFDSELLKWISSNKLTGSSVK
jgi:proline iminopeptidase